MDLIDPSSLPQDHPTLVPDLWVRAMLSHPMVTPELRSQALTKAQLRMNDGEDSHLFVTQNHEALLVATLANLVGIRSFGAEAGLLLNPKHGTVLTYLLLAAKNLRELLSLLARYLPITRLNSTLKFSETPNGASVSIANDNPIVHRNAHYTEFSISSILCVLRLASGHDVHAQRIHLLHENPDPESDLLGVYPCVVEYGARRNEMFFSQETLDLDVITSDARLLEHLQGYGNILLKIRHPGQLDLRNRVEEVVLERLAFGVPTIDNVALRLGLSSRTLSRRLTDHDTSFRKVVDRLRHDLALHYLADAKLSLADIAYLLGYSDQSNFGASFRRMSGKTPYQARMMLGIPLVGQGIR